MIGIMERSVIQQMGVDVQKSRGSRVIGGGRSEELTVEEVK